MNRIWWGLPGPAGFLEAIEQDLRECRNVVLALPEHAPGGLREAVADRVRDGGALAWRRLELGEERQRRPPVELLWERFAADEEASAVPTVKAVAQARRLRGAVIWVDGLVGDDWRTWGRFLCEYEAASRAFGEGEGACLILPAVGPAASSTPPDAVALVTRRWRGIVGLTDMMLYALHLIKEKPIPPLYRRLTAHVIAELSGADPALAATLSALPLASLLQPSEVLSDLANRRGWTAPLPTTGLWALGMEEEVDGRRLLHSAAAAVAGRADEVYRRVWRAQVAVLFPYIEEHRARLVQSLDGQLRVPIDTPFGTITDKRDLEIGQILHQIVRSRVPEGTREFVRRLTEMRHALAHLEVVCAEDLYAAEVQRNASFA